MAKVPISEYMEKSRKDRRLWHQLNIRIFIGILAVFFIIGWAFWARPKKSEVEKRELTKFPKPTAEGIWDGSFFSNLQTWYADTYPLREAMISGQQKLEGLYGNRKTAIYGNTVKQGDEIPVASASRLTEAPTMDGSESVLADSGLDSSSAASSSEAADGTIEDAPEVAGTILVVDGRGFETYYFNQQSADDYASMLNTVRVKLPDQVNLYDIVVPNGFGVCLDDAIQESVGASDQKDAIDYIYSRLDGDVKAVSIFDTLRKHNSEYIYFNTDHHWTALGAYYAYEEFCKAKGIKPHDLSGFEEKDFDGFLGSFYAYSNQSQELADNPDTVKTYVPMGTNDLTYTGTDGKQVQWFVINDVSDYSADAKYSTFIGGDQPFSVIDNPDISDGSSCLVIKESYGNAFVPFLVDHYEKVYVCDYRYYGGNLTALVQNEGIDDVIFINNTEAVVSSRAEKMNSLFH